MSFAIYKLGEKVNFIGGSQPAKSNFIYEPKEGYIRLLQIRDYKSDANITYIPENSTRKFCTKDDIMIGRYGPPIFQILKGLEGAYNVALMKADPHDGVDKDYLYHFLRKPDLFRLLDSLSQRTAGQSGIDMDTLKKYPFPLPPLAEQRRIAAILDKADAIRRKQQQAIDLCDQFLKALFIDMFGDPVTNPKGWEVKKLGKLGQWQSGGTPSRTNKSYYDGTIPWLSSGELNSMYVNDSKEHISEIAIEQSNAKIIPPGSLLLGMYDTAALKSCITTRSMACNQAIIYSLLNESLSNTIYIYFLIQYAKEHYKSQQRGVRQKNLNSSIIKDFSIIFPPIDLQNKFAEIVKKTEAKKAKMQKSLEHLNDNFNSLSQRAFAGKLS